MMNVEETKTVTTRSSTWMSATTSQEEIVRLTPQALRRAQAALNQAPVPGRPQIILSSSTVRDLQALLSGTLPHRIRQTCTRALRVALRILRGFRLPVER